MEAMITSHVPSQHDYRIGAGTVSTDEWLNAFTATPETGGYQQQGDLHPGWQSWLDQALTTPASSRQERRYLLDWYAVRWVLVADGTPYRTEPGAFRLVEYRDQPIDASLFEVRSPTPIATASNAPLALFIGDMAAYDLMLQALAAGEIDSRKLIVVYGGRTASSYTSASLRRFGEVMLYGQPQSTAAAGRLARYVSDGGRLVLDEGEGASLLPTYTGSVGPLRGAGVGPSWEFKDSEPSDVPPRLLKRLPPPDYAGTGQWGVMNPEHLTPTCRPLVQARGQVVLVSCRDGAGQVLWSGLNLPYLAASTQSAAAGQLLGVLATGTVHPSTQDKTVTFERVDSEDLRFGVPKGATTLLVRQYVSPDWHATDMKTGGALRLMSAGPGMTLVLLHGATSVELTYELSSSEVLGIWTSVGGLVILLLYVLGIDLPVRRRLRSSKLAPRRTSSLSTES
ncbi:MAG: hypothetical protein ACRDZ5_06615, partial [Acidimicrobiales bacterium]